MHLLPARLAGCTPTVVLGTVLAVAVLAGCDQTSTSTSDATPTSSTEEAPRSSTAPAGDTDSVQTDAPASAAAVVVTSASADDAGDVQVTAFVEGVVELGGTCTAVVQTGGGTMSSEPVDAEAGASTTDCGPMSVTTGNADDPAETVTVTYSSPTQDLTSAPTEIEQP